MDHVQTITIGPSVVILDQCSSSRRVETNAVRDAWQTVLACDGMDKAEQKVELINLTLRNAGSRVFLKKHAETIKNHIEQHGCSFDLDVDEVDDSFDSKSHCILFDSCSCLYHLRASDLGEGASLVTPHFKLSLLWWQ